MGTTVLSNEPDQVDHIDNKARIYVDHLLELACSRYGVSVASVMQPNTKKSPAPHIRGWVVVMARERVFSTSVHYPRRYTICPNGGPPNDGCKWRPISYPELIRLLPCWHNHSSAILAERRYRAATEDWSVATAEDTVQLAPSTE